MFKDVIEFYGKEQQCMIAMEESAELIQAINKCLRYPDNIVKRDNLIEEIADVIICIEQLEQIYGISKNEIDRFVKYKTDRIYERVKKAKEEDDKREKIE